MFTEELDEATIDILAMIDDQLDEAFHQYVVDCLNEWYERTE